MRNVEQLTDGAVLRVFLADVRHISNLTLGILSVKEPGAGSGSVSGYATTLDWIT